MKKGDQDVYLKMMDPDNKEMNLIRYGGDDAV